MDNSRFRGASWYKENYEYDVMVGGAGGIGSWLTLLLARAGFNVHLYDFDRVEKVNMSGQMFSEKDIGLSKVVGVKRNVKHFGNENVNVYIERVTGHNSILTPFIFSAFDNMEARKNLFETWKKNIPTDTYGHPPIFIDGRLSFEHLKIFCVTPENIEEYENHLFEDDEVENEVCTLKQTTHSATLIASLMTSFFTNHITNIVEKEKIRDVPFSYEFFIPMVLTEIENL